MSDKPNVVGEAADGVRTMFARLGEFFHIFDLPFFVAGTSTAGALMLIHWRLEDADMLKPSGLLASLPSKWLSVLLFFIACYVCGLVTFSFGRSLNGILFRRKVLSTYLDVALTEQGFRDPMLSASRKELIEGGNPQMWRVYIRLWQRLAAKYPNSVAFSHLSRYWAMAATYDGVAASLLIWAIAVAPLPVLGTPPLELAAVSSGSWLPGLVVAISLLLAALLCLRQGGKYYEFQMEDLAAALAEMQPRSEGHE